MIRLLKQSILDWEIEVKRSSCRTVLGNVLKLHPSTMHPSWITAEADSFTSELADILDFAIEQRTGNKLRATHWSCSVKGWSRVTRLRRSWVVTMSWRRKEQGSNLTFCLLDVKNCFLLKNSKVYNPKICGVYFFSYLFAVCRTVFPLCKLPS